MADLLLSAEIFTEHACNLVTEKQIPGEELGVQNAVTTSGVACIPLPGEPLYIKSEEQNWCVPVLIDLNSSLKIFNIYLTNSKNQRNDRILH